MGDTRYFWTAFAPNEDGDLREIEIQGDDIRHYTVTAATWCDILDACGISEAGVRYSVDKDFDGRAFIYRDGGNGEPVCEIESDEICGHCGRSLQSCEGKCGPYDALDAA